MVMDRSKADCQMQQIERPCHASLPAARHAVHQSIATITIVVYIWGYPPTILQALLILLPLYIRATFVDYICSKLVAYGCVCAQHFVHMARKLDNISWMTGSRSHRQQHRAKVPKTTA